VPGFSSRNHGVALPLTCPKFLGRRTQAPKSLLPLILSCQVSCSPPPPPYPFTSSRYSRLTQLVRFVVFFFFFSLFVFFFFFPPDSPPLLSPPFFPFRNPTTGGLDRIADPGSQFKSRLPSPCFFETRARITWTRFLSFSASATIPICRPR